MKILITVLFILNLSIVSLGQHAFGELNTSRYARAVSLGNAFTGLADGIETVYYNSAGIANLNFYALSYSNGNGFAFLTNDYIADDFAILIPKFSEIGKFALSVDRLSLNDNNFGYNLYRLHYARNIVDNLSVGASINFYYFFADSYSSVTNPIGIEEDFSGSSIDMSFSSLFILPNKKIYGSLSETRFGMQLQNLFSNNMSYSNDMDSDTKHQVIRLGISNSIIPIIKKIANLTPLKFIIAADAVFYGSEYMFNLFQPNYGIELTVFDILSLRYGRENENKIGDAYNYSPQHPVKRYGIGLTLPLHKIFKRPKLLEILFDYSYSNWDKIDETKPIYGFISKDILIRESFSLTINYLY